MPTSEADWISVATERSKDAKALKENGRKLAAIYILGYVVECYLKAYLIKTGKSIPTSGSSGHDIRGLWEAAGLRPNDFNAGKRWFVKYWNTGLRYETELPREANFEELCSEGYKLAGYIQNRLRWARRRIRK